MLTGFRRNSFQHEKIHCCHLVVRGKQYQVRLKGRHSMWIHSKYRGVILLWYFKWMFSTVMCYTCMSVCKYRLPASPYISPYVNWKSTYPEWSNNPNATLVISLHCLVNITQLHSCLHSTRWDMVLHSNSLLVRANLCHSYYGMTIMATRIHLFARLIVYFRSQWLRTNLRK